MRAGPGSPIGGINTRPNPTVKTRSRPISRAASVAVFHRVVMDVIEAALKVLDVFQRVLPVFGLPDSATTVTSASRRDGLFKTTGSQPPFCELSLDPSHAFRVRGIPRRERPDAVTRVGQQHNRLDIEGSTALAFAKDFPQVFWLSATSVEFQSERHGASPMALTLDL